MKNVLLLMESVLNVLISAIYGSSTSICRAKGDEDLLCAANVAIGNIRAYMQHQIKDTQKKLASDGTSEFGCGNKILAKRSLSEVLDVFQQEPDDFFLSW